jgi:hypothetical protein
MDTKKITIGVLLATSAVFAVLAFKNPSVIAIPTEVKIDASTLGNQSAPVVNVPAPIVNVPAPVVNVNVPKQTQSQVFGAASPDFDRYVSIGGNRFWGRNSSSLIQATTTPCSLLSPVSTSTLLTSSFRLTSIATSTGPVTITLAKGATPYATTSAIAYVTVQANKVGLVVASTTATNAANLTFAPNEYLVVGVQGSVGVPAGAGTFSLSGICQAVWDEN